MANDDLQTQLKRWGYAQVNRYAANSDTFYSRDAGDHPISRAREFAPMTHENLAKQLAGRDGRARRRFMAAKTCTDKLKIFEIPTWAVDPIVCTESRISGPIPMPSPAAKVDFGVPEELRWIDRALAELSRQNLMRAMCLREEFCGVGTQEMKAAQVQNAFGGRLSVWMYRKEVQRAMDWLSARKAA